MNEKVAELFALATKLEKVIELAATITHTDPYYAPAFRIVTGVRASMILLDAARRLELISSNDNIDLQNEIVKNLAAELKKFKEGGDEKDIGREFDVSKFTHRV